MQTAAADVLPPSTQWLEQQIPSANAEYGREKGKERAWGRLCRVQWWFLVVCWFNFAQEMSKREDKQPPPESTVVQVVQEMVQSHLPSHRQGCQALSCREESEMRLLCLC